MMRLGELMALFNFKKEAKMYIVYGGFQYNIEIADVSIGQTFTENSYPVKTLHQQSNVFEGSVINKANPANFSYTILPLKETDLDIVYDLLIDYDTSNSALQLKTYDIYIKTEQDVFKAEGCISTNGSFLINKTEPLAVEIQGEGKKVSRVGPADCYVIPGTVVARTGTTSFIITKHLDIILGGVTLDSGVAAATVELQNNIEWIPYQTVNGGLDAFTATTSMFPIEYVLTGRILAGSFTRYLVNTDKLLQWDTNTSINLKVGEQVGGTRYGFEFDIPNCSLTNRLSTEAVFTESFDWRMTSNPVALNSIITYNT